MRVGAGSVDDLVLTVPAATALELDDRHTPIGCRGVAGTSLDLTHGRRVGDEWATS
ncbi:hypothetical protein DDP54_13670 [Cellulomonas sp. WB94]|nr:hypothetical protein DDP54_13670 [Cellulomonas sp. WB94]